LPGDLQSSRSSRCGKRFSSLDGVTGIVDRLGRRGRCGGGGAAGAGANVKAEREQVAGAPHSLIIDNSMAAAKKANAKYFFIGTFSSLGLRCHFTIAGYLAWA
jgi:hypothetical protein